MTSLLRSPQQFLRPLALVLAAGALTFPLQAEVRLASPFSDHMVLQQELPVPVWGTAAPGEKVTVDFAGARAAVTADAKGHWRVDLPALAASAESRTFSVAGADGKPLVLQDVLVGEVWICGGQSNMERQLGPRPGQKPIVDWEKEVAAADYPQIRQLLLEQRLSPVPLAEAAMHGTWTVCSPQTSANFTAVGYFFARDLWAARHVPIGLIHSSWGGTPAEAWTSARGLAGFPEFAQDIALQQEIAVDPAKAQRESAERFAKWYADNDPGTRDGDQKITADDSAWEPIDLPKAWEYLPRRADYDGVAWLRRGFDVPAEWAGQEAELRLGAIDDADTTWVNGVEIGATTGYNLPRAYRIPAGTLRATGNVVAIRVLDTGGFGGVWNEKLPLEVAPRAGGSPVSLRGRWKIAFTRPLAGAPYVPASVNASPGVPTVLYNAMIAPLVPYAIRGVTFYQGEANAGHAAQYRSLFSALIADWRRQWGEGDFPFLFVQIAPHRDMPPELREAQLLVSQTVKNTAMAVTIDCGDAADIHPAHKQPVGARLALAARALAYGEKVDYLGPAAESARVDGGRAVLRFSHADGGLQASGGDGLIGFTIAGRDGVFHPAQAEIEKDTVIVSSPEVAKPTAVRYAWEKVATGNLFNGAGLPASPFRLEVGEKAK